MRIYAVIAAILHIGNIDVLGDGSGQARLKDTVELEKVCHLLGLPVSDMQKAILRPTTKAGREVVTQSRTQMQAKDELAALCKTLYERTFGFIVERINKALDRREDQA